MRQPDALIDLARPAPRRHLKKLVKNDSGSAAAACSALLIARAHGSGVAVVPGSMCAVAGEAARGLP